MSPETRLSAALADRYRILHEIGQGGMATVYLAEDVRHERKVALKVLRPELAAVVGAERFLKEIKTTANLQHPHILPLHDSGEVDGGVYYVMPYVEGESLRDRLNRDKQLPVDEAVRIAREVLSALDYAHRRGVVHRDIKPENILLHDGQALVADFGIALAVSTGAGTRMTETGMSLGTPHYMSPEQAMGEREVSARSDVYAMGCVLYEMLLGEPPFTGPTAQAIIARVITEEPRQLQLQRKTIPAHVEAGVLRALSKLPADRFASAAEFQAALGQATSGSQAPVAAASLPTPAPTSTPWRQPVTVGALAVAVVSLAVAGWAVSRAPAPVTAGPMIKFNVSHPGSDRLSWQPGPVAISPDGGTIAYAEASGGVSRIMVHRLADDAARELQGVGGASALAFSPDGEWLAFVRGTALFKLRLAGGDPTKVGEIPLSLAHVTWAEGGVFVVANSSDNALYLLTEDGGVLERLTTPDSSRGEQRHLAPQALPGGMALFDIQHDDGPHPAILSIAARTWKEIGVGVAYATKYTSDHLVYVQGNRLMVVPFDVERQQLAGAPFAVDSVPARPDAGLIWDIQASRSGTVLYTTVVGATEFGQLLVSTDRNGALTKLGLPVGWWNQPRWSPRGDALVSLNFLPSINALDVLPLQGGGRRRVVNDGSTPVWSPDGRSIAHSDLQGRLQITPADGGRSTFIAATEGKLTWPYDWSRDGKTISVYELSGATRRDIYLLQQDGSGWTELPFQAGPANERSAAFSPDSRWIAYASDESGVDEVYVRRNPPADGNWMISTGGGREPVWSGDGSEIFYRRGNEIFAVPVRTSPTFSVDPPKRLFQVDASFIEGPTGQRDWDVSRDGRRFVFIQSPVVTSPFTFTVLLNFQSALPNR